MGSTLTLRLLETTQGSENYPAHSRSGINDTLFGCNGLPEEGALSPLSERLVRHSPRAKTSWGIPGVLSGRLQRWSALTPSDLRTIVSRQTGVGPRNRKGPSLCRGYGNSREGHSPSARVPAPQRQPRPFPRDWKEDWTFTPTAWTGPRPSHHQRGPTGFGSSQALFPGRIRTDFGWSRNGLG